MAESGSIIALMEYGRRSVRAPTGGGIRGDVPALGTSAPQSIVGRRPASHVPPSFALLSRRPDVM